MQTKKLKNDNIIQLAITMAIVVLVGFISSKLFTRFDLTTDKRYTLSNESKSLLKNLDEEIYFKIYLEGDLPAGFLRLQNATRELLDEFRAYSKNNIQYEFINPTKSTNKKIQNNLFKTIYQKGLRPTNLQVKTKDGGSSQKIIFPGIIASLAGNEIPINILKQLAGYNAEQNLNSSIQALEYELILAIKKLTTKQKKRIGIIEGHGEFPPENIADLTNSLTDFYEVYRVNIDSDYSRIINEKGDNNFDLLIIANPNKAFNEAEKFIVDQHILNGGNTAWFINNVDANTDSLAYNRTTYAISKNLNLNDMLFRYGIRINPNIIADMQCGVIPVNTSMIGQKAEFKPAPWIYHSLLIPSDSHVLTKNLDLIQSKFASSIDTVSANPLVKKQFLLASSQYSKTIDAPALIDLASVNKKLNPRDFPKHFLPVAVLLEGKFNSIFTNRTPPKTKNKVNNNFLENGKEAKMLVVSDAEIIKNRTKGVGKNIQIMPMGYDRYTKKTFGNKEFVINSINYLCDNQKLLEARAKDQKIRVLNKAKVIKERAFWQVINTIIPVIIIIIFGLVYNYLRKNKFT